MQRFNSGSAAKMNPDAAHESGQRRSIEKWNLTALMAASIHPGLPTPRHANTRLRHLQSLNCVFAFAAKQRGCRIPISRQGAKQPSPCRTLCVDLPISGVRSGTERGPTTEGLRQRKELSESQLPQALYKTWRAEVSAVSVSSNQPLRFKLSDGL